MTALAKAETTIGAESDLRADYEGGVRDLNTYASDLRRMSPAPEALPDICTQHGGRWFYDLKQ